MAREHELRIERPAHVRAVGLVLSALTILGLVAWGWRRVADVAAWPAADYVEASGLLMLLWFCSSLAFHRFVFRAGAVEVRGLLGSRSIRLPGDPLFVLGRTLPHDDLVVAILFARPLMILDRSSGKVQHTLSWFGIEPERIAEVEAFYRRLAADSDPAVAEDPDWLAKLVGSIAAERQLGPAGLARGMVDRETLRVRPRIRVRLLMALLGLGLAAIVGMQVASLIGEPLLLDVANLGGLVSLVLAVQCFQVAFRAIEVSPDVIRIRSLLGSRTFPIRGKTCLLTETPAGLDGALPYLLFVPVMVVDTGSGTIVGTLNGFGIDPAWIPAINAFLADRTESERAA